MQRASSTASSNSSREVVPVITTTKNPFRNSLRLGTSSIQPICLDSSSSEDNSTRVGTVNTKRLVNPVKDVDADDPSLSRVGFPDQPLKVKEQSSTASGSFTPFANLSSANTKPWRRKTLASHSSAKSLIANVTPPKPSSNSIPDDLTHDSALPTSDGPSAARPAGIVHHKKRTKVGSDRAATTLATSSQASASENLPVQDLISTIQTARKKWNRSGPQPTKHLPTDPPPKFDVPREPPAKRHKPNLLDSVKVASTSVSEAASVKEATKPLPPARPTPSSPFWDSMQPPIPGGSKPSPIKAKTVSLLKTQVSRVSEQSTANSSVRSPLFSTSSAGTTPTSSAPLPSVAAETQLGQALVPNQMPIQELRKIVGILGLQYVEQIEQNLDQIAEFAQKQCDLMQQTVELLKKSLNSAENRNGKRKRVPDDDAVVSKPSAPETSAGGTLAVKAPEQRIPNQATLAVAKEPPMTANRPTARKYSPKKKRPRPSQTLVRKTTGASGSAYTAIEWVDYQIADFQAAINLAVSIGDAAPVTIVNEIDEDDALRLPLNFKYLETGYSLDLDVGPPSVTFGPQHSCACTVCVKPAACACQKDAEGAFNEFGDYVFAYSKDGLARIDYDWVDQGVEVVECNKNCACGSDCANRVAQRPRDVPIEIFKTKDRGWGARATVDVSKGKVLGIYTGLLVRREKAELILGEEKDYLFDLDGMECNDDDDDTPGEFYSVDGLTHGNWTRFINHSCKPNLRVYSVVFETLSAANRPYIAFAALKDIPARTEFLFDYNPAASSKAKKGKTPMEPLPGARDCFCGAKGCRGWF